MQTKYVILQVLNVIFYIFMVVFNGLSSTGLLSENEVGDIARDFPTALLPGTTAFSIWGLIFGWLLFFTIYQALPFQHKKDLLDQISVLYIINTISNGLWVLIWTFAFFWLALLDIFIVLFSLMFIYMRTYNGVYSITGENFFSREKDERGLKETLLDYWFVKFPFSVYTGWVSVATVINISVVLEYDLGLTGNGDVWGALILAVVAALGLIVLFTTLDVVFVGVFIWAISFIVSNQSDLAGVSTAGTVAIVILSVGCGAAFIRRTQLFIKWYKRLQSK